MASSLNISIVNFILPPLFFVLLAPLLFFPLFPFPDLPLFLLSLEDPFLLPLPFVTMLRKQNKKINIYLFAMNIDRVFTDFQIPFGIKNKKFYRVSRILVLSIYGDGRCYAVSFIDKVTTYSSLLKYNHARVIGLYHI